MKSTIATITLIAAASLVAGIMSMSASIAHAQVPPGTAANAQNFNHQGSNAQRGLINLGNTNVGASVNALNNALNNCAVNAAVLGSTSCH
jgi:acetaldehyde dehydrogenase (acetylating)